MVTITDFSAHRNALKWRLGWPLLGTSLTSLLSFGAAASSFYHQGWLLGSAFLLIGGVWGFRAFQRGKSFHRFVKNADRTALSLDKKGVSGVTSLGTVFEIPKSQLGYVHFSTSEDGVVTVTFMRNQPGVKLFRAVKGTAFDFFLSETEAELLRNQMKSWGGSFAPLLSDTSILRWSPE